MSLPLPWVDRIFEKLTLVYGQAFLGRWRDLNLVAVKSDWGYELQGFQACPDAIAWALANLPADQPPTVLAFKALCRKAPDAPRPALPEPPADPVRLRAELAKLAPLVQQVRGAQWVDGRAWARRIVARHDDGARINAFTLRCAREALRMPIDSGVGHA